jgi:trimeric autotransporter adhesin
MKTPYIKLINRSPLRLGLFLTALALACFALSPTARAVCQDACLAESNTVQGDDALISLTTGIFNTATGAFALSSNTTGNNNTANGYHALEGNTTGGRNTATGVGALESNAMGSANTANGYNALYRSTGSNNIALGFNAGIYLMTGSNNIDIGNSGMPSDAAKIRIGTPGMHTGTFIAGIYNVALTGSPVVVNSIGRLGVTTSSARFKEAIKPMDKASEAILALQPVTFRYKKELDPEGIPQFGLVAEEVEKVNPDLVVRDADGKVYTVRYEAVNAMLLNEFLKEHRTVQELKSTATAQEATITQLKSTVAKQETTIAQQQKGIEAVAARLQEQGSKIQKVSAQLELNRPVPQMVLNNQR